MKPKQAQVTAAKARREAKVSEIDGNKADYKAFMRKSGGKYLYSSIKDMRDMAHKEAEKTNDPNTQAKLLGMARGYKGIMDHIDRMTDKFTVS